MQETILGASITLLTTVLVLLLKNVIDQKRESQNWFFEHYITESLDPLISAANVYSYIIFLRIEVLNEKSLFNHNLSFEELIRISSLINCSSVHVLFNLFYLAIDQFEPKDYGVFTDEVKEYISKLEELREKLIGMDIEKKSDIKEISKKEQLKSLCSDFENLASKTIDKFDRIKKGDAT